MEVENFDHFHEFENSVAENEAYTTTTKNVISMKN